MVMAPIASARENAFQIRKIGAYASNKETPMFVDEKRQGDLDTWISAPRKSWADVAHVIERRGWCQRISQTGAGEVCPMQAAWPI
jgi:hypothetical protein